MQCNPIIHTLYEKKCKYLTTLNTQYGMKYVSNCMTVFVANKIMCTCLHFFFFLPVFVSLTCAGHGARVGLGTVETFLTNTLDGLFLRGRAVGRTFSAVGIRGWSFVGTRSACWSEETDKHGVRSSATTHDQWLFNMKTRVLSKLFQY